MWGRTVNTQSCFGSLEGANSIFFSPSILEISTSSAAGWKQFLGIFILFLFSCSIMITINPEAKNPENYTQHRDGCALECPPLLPHHASMQQLHNIIKHPD